MRWRLSLFVNFLTDIVMMGKKKYTPSAQLHH